jgi:D-alanine-D-alanine ligase
VRIVLLHEALALDARADERDALVQLEMIRAELGAAGYETEALPIDLDLAEARRRLLALRPDLVFNLVESLGGSGRLAHLAPALVESLGLPVTGAPAIAVLETTDKLLAKRRMLGAGLPTPAWLEAGREAAEAPDPAALFLVKPVSEDASLDVDDGAMVRGAAAARERLARAARPAFAERYIEGRELNLALLEKDEAAELLPPAEIVFEGWPEGKPRIVGYAAKWQDDSFEAIHTPRRFDFPAEDGRLLSRLGELAHACWRLFGLRGYARVDFRVDAAGSPWILEVNANPCLSPDAGFAAAALRAGLGIRGMLERIVAAALSRPPGRGRR